MLAYVLQAIDWTYIFYGLNYQLGAVLLAASPRWYLYQALGSNFCWMLPWAIVVTVLSLPNSQAWTYYAIIFGGALVFDFLDVGVTLLVWIYRLSRGKVRAGAHVGCPWPRNDLCLLMKWMWVDLIWKCSFQDNWGFIHCLFLLVTNVWTRCTSRLPQKNSWWKAASVLALTTSKFLAIHDHFSNVNWYL